MLLELTVRNFAVIEETRLTLGDGLNVITGETGAGKSLLVDALEFVLGGRVERDLIRAGADGASVEAVFRVTEPTSALSEVLDEHGALNEEGTIVLYRETHREGRTISRLNGRAVPVAGVRAVGSHLVDIHGQGGHLSLLDPASQMLLLDAFAGAGPGREEVAALVVELRRGQEELAALTADARQAEQERDLLRFQAEEIGSADITPGEEAALIGQRDLLANARAIQEACAAAYETLYAGGTNASDQIAEAVQVLRHTPDPTGALAPQIDAMETSAAQIEEAAREVRAHGEATEADSARQDAIEDRLVLVRRLKRKYGDTEEAVLAFGEEALRKLDVAGHTDERCEQISAELAELRTRTGTAAWDLSLHRQEAAAALGEAVTIHLRDVGLDRVRLLAQVTQVMDEQGLAVPDGGTYAFDANGVDRVEFQVETNSGEGLKPLAKVASGGETSRLMLALKSAIEAGGGVSTLVFDEIDVGIGARASEVVGHKLGQLGRGAQVLCVTHLPQIAAFANRHFRVDKAVMADRTYAFAEALSDDARVGELAEMLGGKRSPELDEAAYQMLLGAAAIRN